MLPYPPKGMHIFIGNGGTKMVTNPGVAICCLTIFIVWGSFSQIFCHPRNWVFILIAATCITAGLLKLTMVYWFRGGYPMHIFIANGGTKMVIDSGVAIFFLTTPATSRRPGRRPFFGEAEYFCGAKICERSEPECRRQNFQNLTNKLNSKT